MLEIWEVFSQRLYDKFVPYILTQCGINKLFKFTNFLRMVRHPPRMRGVFYFCFKKLIWIQGFKLERCVGYCRLGFSRNRDYSKHICVVRRRKGCDWRPTSSRRPSQQPCQKNPNCMGANRVVRAQGEQTLLTVRDGDDQAAWSCAVDSWAECAALLDAERWVLSQMKSENWMLNAGINQPKTWLTAEICAKCKLTSLGLFSHSCDLTHRCTQ